MPTIIPGASLPLKGNGQTVTVSTPLLNLTQTWNAGGVQFTAMLLRVTDTASASSSLLFDIGTVGSGSLFTVDKTGTVKLFASINANSQAITGLGTIRFGANSATILTQDADGVLALRNGGSAQTQRWYNTFTDASTGEWVELLFASNVARLRTNANGTGTLRNLQLSGRSNLILSAVSGAGGEWSFSGDIATASASGLNINGNYTASSGVNPVFQIVPTITQTSTAGYTALQVNVTESSVGSGTKLLADLQVGGISKFSVSNNGTLTVGGGQVVAVRVVTAAGAVTVATTDFVVEVNKTVGAATTVNLPAAPTTGLTFVIKDGKGDAAANNITVTPAAGNIDGAATKVMNTNFQSITVRYDGTQWIIT